MSSHKPRIFDRLRRPFKRSKGESSSAPSNRVVVPEGEDVSVSIQTATESIDTRDTKLRYVEAAKELEKAIKRREREWGSFQIPELKGEPDDTSQERFRESIYQIFEKRRAETTDQGLWNKSKRVAECFFQALSPAMKNFLTVASSAAQVRHQRSICPNFRSKFSILTGWYAEVSFYSLL